MEVKFNRSLIATINSTQSAHSDKNKETGSKCVAIPEKETFKYILENAKKGNEMAAVLIDEWQRYGKPKDEQETKIVKSINNAVDKIFR